MKHVHLSWLLGLLLLVSFSSPVVWGQDRDMSKDFNMLRDTGNETPQGLWSDGTTMWVGDRDGNVSARNGNRIYAYNLETKEHDVEKDFLASTLVPAGNGFSYGICSDGVTMWIVDHLDDIIYAYNLGTTHQDPNKRIRALDGGNRHPRGIWSDGTTMWVSDWLSNKLYAYDLATKRRDADKDFNTLEDAGNTNALGICSDGTTMWVADFVDKKLYAYNLASKARDAIKDFNTLSVAGNDNPSGICSDGTTMWVADTDDDKLYAYTIGRTSTNKRSQTITFTLPATGIVGDNIPVNATTDAMGLTVRMKLTTVPSKNVASFNADSTMLVLGPHTGRVTIVVSQAGNETYASVSVSRMMEVTSTTVPPTVTTMPLGTNELEETLVLYPNAVREVLYLSDVVDALRVYDTRGQLLLTGTALQQLDVRILASGTYVVEVVRDGEISRYTIVKE